VPVSMTAPSASKAAAQLQQILQEYPLAGQSESWSAVDAGGNRFVTQGEGGVTKMEFYSSGQGNFAKVSTNAVHGPLPCCSKQQSSIY